jgi:hypothetical protein
MATQSGKSTSFRKVSVVVGDVAGFTGFTMDGFDDGTSISEAVQGDRGQVRTGNDGQSVFAIIETNHSIWTFNFFESSDTVDRIDAWVKSEIPAPMTVKDGNGRTVLSGLSFPRQRPGFTKAAGVEVRTVDIHMTGTTGKIGGLNNPA